jgi:hypothetical protein
MGWKATGPPTVRKQRDKWAVRVDGIDTESGKHRPRQLGTYPSQRSALKAARSVSVQERVATRDTVGWLVRRYVASRSDVTQKAREQYEWAIPHIEAGLGAIRLDRLDREDVARWIDDLADAGQLSWRSIQICRTVLRAALADAVEEGLGPQSGCPGAHAKGGGQAAQEEGGRSVDRRASGALPGGQRRPPLGRRLPPRRPLRPAPVRGTCAQVERPRHGEGNAAHRRGTRCGAHRGSLEPGQERALETSHPSRRRDRPSARTPPQGTGPRAADCRSEVGGP